MSRSVSERKAPLIVLLVLSSRSDTLTVQFTRTFSRVSSVYQNLSTCQFSLPGPIHVSGQSTGTYSCVNSVYRNLFICQFSLPGPTHVSVRSVYRNLPTCRSVYHNLYTCQFILPEPIYVSVHSTRTYSRVMSVNQDLLMCQFSLP